MKTFRNIFALGVGMALLTACSDQPGSDSSGATNSSTENASTEIAEQTPSADNVDTIDGTSLAQFDGDPAAGERVFLQCRACHVVDPGVNRAGPSLAGIIGSTSGIVEGFNYSDANANSAITWTPEKMNQFLENPRRVIPGTRMAFAGLRDGQDRADIIAYLQAN